MTTTPASAVSARRERWWPEGRRTLVSTLIACAVAAVVISAWIVLNPGDRAILGPLGTSLTWAVLVGSHGVLTRYAFTGLAGVDLERALEASGGRNESARRRPSWSVQVSTMALVVVALLVIVPVWREHPLLVACALAMVAASWADMVFSFALHYAAIDDGDLVFPEGGTDTVRSFDDYTYLAAAVQTTFAVPDVSVRSTWMRRQLSIHTVLAFLFNTVILAVVVTFLIGT